MRCAGCDHILWNHPAPADGAPRTCPECGRRYAVADFEFAPGKVEFHCPSCDQTYFGTSATGHLQPSAFDCVSCGRHLTEEQCSVRPHGDVDLAEPMLREPLPWLEAGGVFSRWWRTTTISITRAARLPSMLRAQPALGPALVYLAINSWISAAVGAFFGIAWFLLTIGVFSAAGGGGFPGLMTPGMMPQLITQIAAFLLAPVFTLVIAASTACFAALPGGRFGADFRRFLEILAYATGNLLFGIIPFCGALIAYLLWIVQAGQGIAESSPRGRAAAPVILAIVGFLIGVAIVTVGSFAVSMLAIGL